MTRTKLNLTTANLEMVVLLADAQRELRRIGAELLASRTSKREQRADFGRRLHAIAESLSTVEVEIGNEL